MFDPNKFALRLEALQVDARKEADRLDTAWFARADSRAVQGGAFCKEANQWREIAGKLRLALRTIPE